MSLQTIVFAGPSLTPAIIQLITEKGFTLFPPIKRGDLQGLINNGFKGRIVIADGVFQQVLSVGHHEIKNVIASGCEVLGVSSMGAIRAYELRQYGMQGHGKVYSHFLEYEDFMDDEVALLFDPIPPYRIISEPLVHFRECVSCLIDDGQISPDKGNQVIEKLKQLYFGERTLHVFEELIFNATGRRLNQLINNFDIFRCKSSDLFDCVSLL